MTTDYFENSVKAKLQIRTMYFYQKQHKFQSKLLFRLSKLYKSIKEINCYD